MSQPPADRSPQPRGPSPDESGEYAAAPSAADLAAVQVAAQPSRWRRLSWPVVGFSACILGLAIALVLAVTGVSKGDGTTIDPFRLGYQEDYAADPYDSGYGGTASSDLDPFDADDQPEIIATLVKESGIEQLTDICLDYGFGSLDIGGSRATDPDLIEYWSYDGFEPWQLASKPEVSDVRFAPDEYELATYAQHRSVITDEQGLTDADLGMVCITTENGDDVPRAAYYFIDPVKGVYNPIVYVDLQTLAVVD